MDSALLQKFMDENNLSLYNIYFMYNDLKSEEISKKYRNFADKYKYFIGRYFALNDDDGDEYYTKIIGIDRELTLFIGVCCYSVYYFTKSHTGTLEEYEPLWRMKFYLSEIENAKEISAEEYAETAKKVLGEFLEKDWKEEIE